MVTPGLVSRQTRGKAVFRMETSLRGGRAVPVVGQARAGGWARASRCVILRQRCEPARLACR